MVRPIRLVDFGSTYTKVAAVDVEQDILLGTAQAFTTLEDIALGLERATCLLLAKTGPLAFEQTLACSSAAGGLSMVAIGLVPSLTEKAARLACFGAGAKISKSYAYELTEADAEEIKALEPDIVLLTGGTDGGNQQTIVHNARMLASIKKRIPIVVAGNRSAAFQIRKILQGEEAFFCENVMPALNELNLEPVKETIRTLFLNKIVKAKGFERQNILMPTPVAVLEALSLLASDWGDLLAIDVGGATTDVYSLAPGRPKSDTVLLKGAAEPYAKRTVEGDIGMRCNASGIVEAVGFEALSKLAGPAFAAFLEKINRDPNYLPNPKERKCDSALAFGAVKTAVLRHAGQLEAVYTPIGQAFFQSGKDLREVGALILTGGALIYGSDLDLVAKAACFDEKAPQFLKPCKPKAFIDKHYLLAAMGLLANDYPRTALALMKKELHSYEIKG